MATNTGKGYRKGAVGDRTQALDPRNDKFVKRNRENGEFMDVKSDDKPFKGVAKEPDRRQDKK